MSLISVPWPTDLVAGNTDLRLTKSATIYEIAQSIALLATANFYSTEEHNPLTGNKLVSESWLSTELSKLAKQR